MFCCLLLALASQKERKQRWIIFHVLNIIISEFLPFLFILHVGCKTPSLNEIYGSRRYVWIREHHLIVFSSQIFRLGSFSIYFFYFPHLFIHISIFTNPKNDISTIDQGFSIFARSLEALVRFISSLCSFSFFHRSFPLSKSKNIKKYLPISIS